MFPQAVRSAGKIESNAVFQKTPHTYGVRKNRTAVRIPTKPFSPKGLVRVWNSVTCYRFLCSKNTLSNTHGFSALKYYNCIGRSVRLRETMKARYKAKIIYRKSAQIRAIRGDSSLHAGFFTLTFDHVCSTTETMISAMPRTNEKFNSWYSWKINIARMML